MGLRYLMKDVTGTKTKMSGGRGIVNVVIGEKLSRIVAPWTKEQVDALNNYQQGYGVHPYTCARAHLRQTPLVATTNGWKCSSPLCDYTQSWAHSFMAEKGWI